MWWATDRREAKRRCGSCTIHGSRAPARVEAGLASLVGGLHHEFEFAIERSRQQVDTASALAQLRTAVMGS